MRYELKIIVNKKDRTKVKSMKDEIIMGIPFGKFACFGKCIF
jgi:hypothetical protein